MSRGLGDVYKRQEDKIADIKARMAAGTYNISSEAVADKILNNISTLTF